MNEIFTFEKMYKAYLDCRKTKRNTINALKFEYNLERNIYQLQKELETKTYKPGRSICFVAKEPSLREIFAASFRDRVVHHLLIREINKIGEKTLIFDTFSCRKSKGTHAAVARLKNFIKKATENYKKEAFYIQLDISGFFMAINHNILYKIFEKMILKQKKTNHWKNDMLWLAKNIIFHKPTENYIIKSPPSLFDLIPKRKSLFGAKENKGLPIGNYSSQFFANLYLNELDQFVKRNLECEYYVRYVDDFIVLNKNRSAFINFENKINNFLQKELDLELNFKKTKFCPISKGIEFLGYFIKPGYVLVKQSVVKRFKNKLNNVIPSLTGNPHSLVGVDFRPYRTFGFRGNDKSIQSVLATINSYYGHFRYAFSFNLRKAIFQKHLSMGLKGKFLAPPNYNKIIFK
ncbi:MAG: hypothetical protein A2358_03640 [Candidatus Staskawiczbacteria bacterium RIFOXYB1_FULL_37_44]|uniref:Reverse transcriptase domain-containing protein n=1 Tax=Candidatus Staskawiczbacteria bacterium RIFOXYB1_FULL_37_44 TaxID=1802223 RepID=A0A1G2IY34_9BACT|nr:MAG: hypothetical protein A2358_03640 [Candidatus Staskawiczbacteria bacterium RIFOXYB1_FULL_37_44]OGZ84372.1 MAG: hypothetical protein A2416_01810 [Candidatus Staskawiczbacteria bacterium RIFOXYC1_FULL_37_52]OGZ89804.1 MAG: hypothetical protein A2581_00980 [Candidatus Staskawiczbacteria bacterium RIFOXYD1_FULL_37_110]